MRSGSPPPPMCSPSSARRLAADPPTTSALPMSGSTTATACSGRVQPPITRARRDCSPTRLRRQAAARDSTRRRTATSPTHRSDEFPLLLTTGRVLAHYQSGNQTRRIAALQDALPEPLVEMHPVVARRARHQRRRYGHRRHATRIDDVPREDHARHPRRRHLRAVPLGRHAVGQPPDQPCARSDQPDAGVQGLRSQLPERR